MFCIDLKEIGTELEWENYYCLGICWNFISYQFHKRLLCNVSWVLEYPDTFLMLRNLNGMLLIFMCSSETSFTMLFANFWKDTHWCWLLLLLLKVRFLSGHSFFVWFAHCLRKATLDYFWRYFLSLPDHKLNEDGWEIWWLCYAENRFPERMKWSYIWSQDFKENLKNRKQSFRTLFQLTDTCLYWIDSSSLSKDDHVLLELTFIRLCVSESEPRLNYYSKQKSILCESGRE